MKDCSQTGSYTVDNATFLVMVDGAGRQTVYSSVILAVIACIGAFYLWIRVDRVHYIRSPHYSPGCGDWQQKYAKLHRQIIGGQQPKRLCVATTQTSEGLYDRMTGERSREPSSCCRVLHSPRASCAAFGPDHHHVRA